MKAAQQRLLEMQRQEQQRVQAELDEARDRLVRQTRLAALGQLASSVAHELRQPLGTVRSAAFLLKRRIPAEQTESRRYLDIIDKVLQRADQIITNLTAMTRGQPPAKMLVPLEPVVTEARFRAGAPPQVRWHYHSQPNPFPIYADPAQLEQVFRNLFLNSVEALGRSGKITVTATRLDRHDQILVFDTGHGVAEQVRQRLFEPLVTTKDHGTGLGLTICRQIIQQHGGTIELLCSDNLGTTIQILLPLPDDKPESS